MTTELLSGLVGGLVGYALKSGDRPPSDADVVEALRQTKPSFVKTVAIDTSQARDTKEYVLTGNYLFIENPDTPTLPVYIRLNEPDAEQIELTSNRKIKAPFYRFFITNAAGAGTLNLVIGKAFDFELAEAVVNMKVVAQTANIEVDIVAQAIGNIAINIAASAITLDINIASQGAFNLGIDIKAQTIGNLAVNIAASAVTLQVNIASQTADININIATQAANLDVNIAAQTIGNLSIDLVAQTIANLDMNINAQNIGLMLQSAWAASIGTDKEFDSADVNQPYLGATTFVYTVPAGKTLYLTSFNTQLWHTNPKEAAAPLYFISALSNNTALIAHCRSGGIGGQELQFTKPIVIPENEDLVGLAYNTTRVHVNIAIHASGYEI